MNNMNALLLFKVGDTVCWGFNGDYSPGVVVRVTPATVEVEQMELVLDKAIAKNGFGDAPGCRYIEGEPGVSFKPAGLRMGYALFKRKKDGTFRDGSVKSGRVLHHGARYERNPSF
jgi:hypothetical protein